MLNIKPLTHYFVHSLIPLDYCLRLGWKQILSLKWSCQKSFLGKHLMVAFVWNHIFHFVQAYSPCPRWQAQLMDTNLNISWRNIAVFCYFRVFVLIKCFLWVESWLSEEQLTPLNVQLKPWVQVLPLNWAHASTWWPMCRPSESGSWRDWTRLWAHSLLPSPSVAANLMWGKPTGARWPRCLIKLVPGPASSPSALFMQKIAQYDHMLMIIRFSALDSQRYTKMSLGLLIAVVSGVRGCSWLHFNDSQEGLLNKIAVHIMSLDNIL